MKAVERTALTRFAPSTPSHMRRGWRSRSLGEVVNAKIIAFAAVFFEVVLCNVLVQNRA